MCTKEEILTILPFDIPYVLKELILQYADELCFDSVNKHTNIATTLKRACVTIVKNNGGYNRVFLNSKYGYILNNNIINIYSVSNKWDNRALGLTKSKNKSDDLIGWVSCNDDPSWCEDSTYDTSHLLSVNLSCIDINNIGRVQLNIGKKLGYQATPKKIIFQIDRIKKKLKLFTYSKKQLIYCADITSLDLKNFHICFVIHTESSEPIYLL